MQKAIVMTMFAPLMTAVASQKSSIQESMEKMNAEQRHEVIQAQCDEVKTMVMLHAETLRQGGVTPELQNALNQLEAAENAVIDGWRISHTILTEEELRDQKLLGEPEWMYAANIAKNLNTVLNAGLKNTTALIDFYISNRQGTESVSAVLFEVARYSEALKNGATVGEDLSEQDVENLINKIKRK